MVYEGNEPYIFVSYAHKDTDAVIPIVEGLQNQGFRIWYDSGIEAGSEWPEYIAEHLLNSECFLCFVSAAASDSHNCRSEIYMAVERRINTMVVYIDDSNLSPGLQLKLGPLQSVFKSNYPDNNKLVEALCAARIMLSCKGADEADVTVDAGCNTDNSAQDSFMQAVQDEELNDIDAIAVQISKLTDLSQEDADILLSLEPEQALFDVAKSYVTSYETINAVSEERRWSVHGTDAGDVYGRMQYLLGKRIAENNSNEARALERARACFQKSASVLYPYGIYELAKMRTDEDAFKDVRQRQFALLKVASEMGDMHSMYGLADCYRCGTGVEKNLETAISMYQSIVDSSSASTLLKVRARICLGDCYWGLEKYNEAASCYETTIQSAGGYGAELARALKWYGLCQGKLGNRAAEIDGLQKAATVYEELGRDADVASCYRNIGDSYWFLSEYDKAASWYEKAVSGYEQAVQVSDDYRAQLADAQKWLGMSQGKLGNHTAEVDALQKAAEIFGLLGNGKEVAGCYNAIGYGYFCLGDYKKLAEWVAGVAHTAEGYDDESVYARVVKWQALSLEKLGDDISAETKYMEYCELCKKLGWQRDESFCYEKVGRIAWDRGNYKDARDYWLKARDVLAEMKQASPDTFEYASELACYEKNYALAKDKVGPSIDGVGGIVGAVVDIAVDALSSQDG